LQELNCSRIRKAAADGGLGRARLVEEGVIKGTGPLCNIDNRLLIILTHFRVLIKQQFRYLLTYIHTKYPL